MALNGVYVGWQKTDKKSLMSDEIEQAIDRYRLRHDREPDHILMNPEDYVGPEFAGITVKEASYVHKGIIYVGHYEEREDHLLLTGEDT